MKVGSLFSGIGGMDLGFERAGFEIAWQVEIEPYCLKVLEKHWPDVKRYTDITKVGFNKVEKVDLLCGGFPCQDLSYAGKREGINGKRSGLWSEFARAISVLRPRYVLVENVPGLLTAGIGKVLGDLSEIGYDAEWEIISAAQFGAPHLRKRIWIIAYPNNSRDRTSRNGIDGNGKAQIKGRENQPFGRISGRGKVANSGRNSLALNGQSGNDKKPSGNRNGVSPNDGWQFWEIEPDVGRVANGIPSRVDRLKGLGNAVVPQIVEWIGNQIMKCERSSNV